MKKNHIPKNKRAAIRLNGGFLLKKICLSLMTEGINQAPGFADFFLTILFSGHKIKMYGYAITLHL